MIPPGAKDPSTEKAIQTIAAAWLCQQDEGFTPESAEEFARWRAADPRHAVAIRRVEQARQLLEKLPAAMPVVPFPAARPFRTHRAAWVALAAAAALALGIGLRSHARHSQDFTRRYSAPAQGIDRVTLPDRSSVTLNAGSVIDVAFTAPERHVTLVRGEAHFQVAKNKARPFVVTAGHVSVRAVGTAFDVRRSPVAVEVVVTEGRVQVRRMAALPAPRSEAGLVSALAAKSSSEAPAESILVARGESAMVLDTGTGLPEIKKELPSAISEKLSWEQPRLVFADTPLSEVVKQFNRFNTIQLVLADPELAKLPLVGSFRPDNLDAFVRLLEQSQRVTVERKGAVLVLRSSR